MFDQKIQFHIGDNPELSELVQRKLFDMGYAWEREGVWYTETRYLYAYPSKELSHSYDPVNDCRSIDPYEFIEDYLTLKPISYEGCNKVIAHFLKKGMAVKCVGEGQVTMVSGYAEGTVFLYRGKSFNLETGTQPTFKKPTTTYVKKASEIIAWCEENGRWDGDHWILPETCWTVAYICDIAGKPSENDATLPEWLEER